MKEFGLKAKVCSYLIDDGSKDKKPKVSLKCLLKINLKFEDYKNCLKVNKLNQTVKENVVNHLDINKIDIYSFKEFHKEFIKDNKLIFKSQQRFKSERHLLKKLSDCFKFK